MQFDEDFARWREDPVTRTILKALEAAEAAQQAAWEEYSWGGGKVRPDELADTLKELRVRADCYRALIDMQPDDIREWLGIEDDE